MHVPSHRYIDIDIGLKQKSLPLSTRKSRSVQSESGPEKVTGSRKPTGPLGALMLSKDEGANLKPLVERFGQASGSRKSTETASIVRDFRYGANCLTKLQFLAAICRLRRTSQLGNIFKL